MRNGPLEDKTMAFHSGVRRLVISSVLSSLVLSGAMLAGPDHAVAQSFAPVAVVNDDIITGYDLQQRMRLIQLTTGNKPDEEAALDALIEDILRLQAAKRVGIDPGPDEVKSGFDEVSRSNNRDPDRMRSGLLSEGVALETLDSQIKSEVAWRQLILRRFGNRVRISENEIDAMVVPKSGAKPGETEYLLAEIRLPVSAGGEQAARQAAQKIIARLGQGERFSVVAREVSNGPTAQAGGDLGWVAKSGLSAAALPVVAAMNVDRVSAPFTDGGDVVLYGLRDSREAGTSGKTVYNLAQLVVGVSAGASQQEADAALARANAARAQVNTCADVKAAAAQYLSISGDLGDLELSKMPGPVREVVAGLEPGDKTQAVRSNDGFHIIVVCDKKSEGPSGDALRARAGNQLRSQRLEQYARGLLRELKREAVIDRR